MHRLSLQLTPDPFNVFYKNLLRWSYHTYSTLFSSINFTPPYFLFRSNEFKEDDAVWKGGEDGGVGGGGPLPTGPNNLGPTGGYVAKYVL